MWGVGRAWGTGNPACLAEVSPSSERGFNTLDEYSGVRAIVPRPVHGLITLSLAINLPLGNDRGELLAQQAEQLVRESLAMQGKQRSAASITYVVVGFVA